MDVVADRYAKYHKEGGFNLMELGWVHHEGAWAAVEACEKMKSILSSRISA
ncbi:MAG: hypothetical protein IJN40_06045 [Clostridia bacterium]|nr:hypothetical protein [Clostridia bacterium]